MTLGASVVRTIFIQLIGGLLAFGFFMSGAIAQTVFINEIHYDNVGTDADEAIEIAGPAGTDLAGWSLVLYNGDPTSRSVYDTKPLSGVIPNQASGFGALAFTYPANGIQDGSPDGIALVNASGAMVQFLSYEGSFIAANGLAAGLTSVDPRAMTTRNRPALAQTFQTVGNPPRMTVVVNHFKSKGSACDANPPAAGELFDPDLGDG